MLNQLSLFQPESLGSCHPHFLASCLAVFRGRLGPKRLERRSRLFAARCQGHDGAEVAAAEPREGLLLLPPEVGGLRGDGAALCPEEQGPGHEPSPELAPLFVVVFLLFFFLGGGQFCFVLFFYINSFICSFWVSTNEANTQLFLLGSSLQPRIQLLLKEAALGCWELGVNEGVGKSCPTT